MQKLAYAGLTDVGMKRTHNEDDLQLCPDHNLFIVADGMGGHASGEVASAIAVETVAGFFKTTSDDQDITWPFKEDKSRSFVENLFVNSVRYANLRVFQKACEDAAYKGMGTTFVGCHIQDTTFYTAHVGDSRCYRVRNGQLDQLTEDHSLLNDYKKMAKLTPEEEANFPHKNIIVRALGMKDSVLVDLGAFEIEQGDLYVLCSDGLNGELTDPQILDICLANPDDLEELCRELIKHTNAHGGKDNTTVVAVRVDEQ
ncbi:MAG: serine/threonine protein phosphatase PrpC [Myxococcota bacterium]|jgi:serine/threonine protein phosphatase PrpC